MNIEKIKQHGSDFMSFYFIFISFKSPKFRLYS